MMRVALLAVAAVAVEATQTVYTIPDKDAFGASYAQFAAACMVLGAAFIVLAVLSKTYCWLCTQPLWKIGPCPQGLEWMCGCSKPKDLGWEQA